MKSEEAPSFPQTALSSSEEEYLHTNLCDECLAVLRFDDGQLGGYEGQLEREIPVLVFNERNLNHELAQNELMGGIRFTSARLRFDILPHLPHLAASEMRGCTFCKTLYRAVQGLLLPFDGDIQLSFSYRWNTESGVGDYGLCQLNVGIKQSRREPLEADRDEGNNTVNFLQAHNLVTSLDNESSVTFLIEPGRGDCQDWLKILPAPKENPLCETTLSTVGDALASGHQESDSSGDPKFLPTRLLDLEAPDTKNGIRLVETSCLDESIRESLQYIALSYCWGPLEDAIHQLKTTSESYPAHLRDIPFASFTPVIQDAATVARSLQVRYLWVDALCIIQGTNDWDKESPLMGLIYSHAYVTICTPASSSCLQGFLQRKNTPFIEVPFHSSINPKMRGTYRLRQSGTEYFPIIASRNYDMHTSKWFKRAWTFQEPILSNWNLVFGDSRIILATPERTWMEPGVWKQSSFFTCLPNIFKQYRQGLMGKETFLSHWQAQVNIYAARQLTYPGDKFPAISGLAKPIADLINDTYVAGLWKGDLLRGLLWNAQGPLASCSEYLDGLVASRSSNFISPSWSWAAHTIVDTNYFTANTKPSFFNEYSFRTECKEIYALSTTEAENLNPFGRIKDASLNATGRLARVTSLITRVGRFQWAVEFDSVSVAGVSLDWEMKEDEKSLPGNIAMLLLASSLSNIWPSMFYGNLSQIEWRQHLSREREPCEDETATRAPNHEEGSGSADEEFSSSEDSLSDLSSGISINPDVNDSAFDMHMSYGKEQEAFFNQNKEERASVKNRTAWGLLLWKPNNEDGRYYRIGCFRVDHSDGGLWAFRDCAFEEVEVI